MLGSTAKDAIIWTEHEKTEWSPYNQFFLRCFLMVAFWCHVSTFFPINWPRTWRPSYWPPVSLVPNREIHWIQKGYPDPGTGTLIWDILRFLHGALNCHELILLTLIFSAKASLEYQPPKFTILKDEVAVSFIQHNLQPCPSTMGQRCSPMHCANDWTACLRTPASSVFQMYWSIWNSMLLTLYLSFSSSPHAWMSTVSFMFQISYHLPSVPSSQFPSSLWINIWLTQPILS